MKTSKAASLLMATALVVAVIGSASAGATGAMDVSTVENALSGDQTADSTLTSGATGMHFGSGILLCKKTDDGGCDAVGMFGTIQAAAVAVAACSASGGLVCLVGAGYFV